MDVNRVYAIVRYCVEKNLQNGYVSPEDFYTVINTAQQQYLDYILGEYQRYQAGRPIAVVEMGNKEKIRQSIAPLIYNITLTPNVTTGIASFPSDFEISDSLWTVYGGSYNIKFTQQPRLANFRNSSIDLIADNPVYIIRHEGFQFFPNNIGLANLSYVRKPPSIVWGYLLDSNGNAVWNPSTSQNPVWGDMDMMNIISRALMMFGVSLDAPSVAQYAGEVKNTGQ